MTKIILQAKPQQEPARLIIETNFPDGSTQPYALTNASITHFTKATKEDGILFLTNSGIENVQIHRDNTTTNTKFELEMAGAINVYDPIAFREQYNLPQVDDVQSQLEKEMSAVCNLTEKQDLFWSNVSKYNDEKKTTIKTTDIPPMNPIFGTQPVISKTKKYKGLEVEFPNQRKIQYVYTDDTAPLLNLARTNGNVIYFDMGLDPDKMFGVTSKPGDFTPSRPLTPIRIKALTTVPENARELVFRGAANVQNPKELREKLGYEQLTKQLAEREEDYYAIYVGNEYTNQHNLSSSLDFLERTKFIYNKPTNQQSKQTILQPTITPEKQEAILLQPKKQTEMKNSKYRLLENDYKIVVDKSRIYNSKVKVYRIEAIKNFSDVKKGDKGGYVSDLSSIGQSGKSWVYDDAIVSGTARVTANATVHGNSHIMSNVRLRGDAQIKDMIIQNDKKSDLIITSSEWKPEITKTNEITNDKSNQSLDVLLPKPEKEYWDNLTQAQKDELTLEVYNTKTRLQPYKSKKEYDELTLEEKRLVWRQYDNETEQNNEQLYLEDILDLSDELTLDR